MNLVRGALLGTAAALTFGASAMAADLPSRKAAPVAYVKVCDVYGRGFYFIPGTNTCLRVGGRVRFVVAYRPSTNVWRHNQGRSGGRYYDGRMNDTLGWRSRAYVNMDARTQTAWGTVQTVISIALRSRSGLFGGSSEGPKGNISASPQVYAAYIRFAGFTAGRARGNFYFMPSRMLEPQYYSSSSTGEVQLAYTAVLGGGVSATLALEDHTDFGYETRFSGLNVGGTGYPVSATAEAINRSVAVIGNVRIDKGWGKAQIMAAYVPNQWLVDNGAASIHSASKAGWAVGLGLTFNLPSLSKRDKIHFMAAYADGALDFTHSRYATGNTSHGRMMGGMRAEYANVHFYTDPVSGSLRSASNTSWSIAAIFEHQWSKTLKSNFAASYLNIDAPAIACAQNWYTAGGICGTKAYSIAANLEWSPTRGFVIIGELAYRKNINNLGSAGPVWGSAAAPNTIGVKKDPDMFFGRLRVQRTF